MSYKNFCLYALLLILLIFPCNMALNYLINPYEIFSHSFMPKGMNSNLRYEKIAYLQKEHYRFNGYLVGNSRIGFIEPKLIEYYLSDSRFYNVSIPSSNLLDTKIFLGYIIEKQYPLKYAIIQISIDYALVMKRATNDPQDIWHYDVTHTGAFDFYKACLAAFLLKGNFSKMKQLLTFNELPILRDSHTGTWHYTAREKQRVQKPLAYAQNEPSLHTPPPKNPQNTIDTDQLELLAQTLQDINALCKNNHIECIIYTSPMHANITKHYTQELLDSILTLMAKSLDMGFWHFSYLNSITTNNLNFYEVMHHIPAVDTLTLKRMFEGDSAKSDVPSDFGIFITKDNLPSALSTMHRIESPYR